MRVCELARELKVRPFAIISIFNKPSDVFYTPSATMREEDIARAREHLRQEPASS